MSTAQQEILELENKLPALKQKYTDCLAEFLSLPQDQSRVTQRRASLQAWHTSAVDFFNAYDRLIATGSLTGADKDSTWYTDKAESSANVLDSVETHFRTLFAKADELHLSRDLFMPSRTAFANMQRRVQATDPAHALELRVRFASTGITTHGFDTPGSSKPNSDYSASLWEKIVAFACACLVLLLVLFVVLRNEAFSDPNQVILLRIVLSFSVATLGAVIPGFLHVGITGKGAIIRAGGALALFVITFFFTPAVIQTP